MLCFSEATIHQVPSSLKLQMDYGCWVLSAPPVGKICSHYVQWLGSAFKLDQDWTNILTGGTQWVLKCARDAGADGWSVWWPASEEEKGIMGYVENMLSFIHPFSISASCFSQRCRGLLEPLLAVSGWRLGHTLDQMCFSVNWKQKVSNTSWRVTEGFMGTNCTTSTPLKRNVLLSRVQWYICLRFMKKLNSITL